MITRNTWVHLILILMSLILILPACQKDPLSSTSDDLSVLSGSPRLKTSPNVENLDKILTLISEKVQSGEIPKGIGNSLTAKVNSAKSSIAKGQLKAAENVLKAFTNQVTDLITEGVLAEVLGGQLSQLAYEVFNPPTWKCGDNFTDARDGHVYKSVQIGNQCWMGENLNYGIKVDGTLNQTNNGIIEKYCYDDNDLNCETYGGLYQWDEAMGYNTIESSRGICPPGWHLPSDGEWKVLEGTADSKYPVGDPQWNLLYRIRGFDAGKQLMSRYGWFNNQNGLDGFGFTALASGMRYYGDNPFFWMIGRTANFWTSSMNETPNPIMREMVPEERGIYWGSIETNLGISVRCLLD